MDVVSNHIFVCGLNLTALYINAQIRHSTSDWFMMILFIPTAVFRCAFFFFRLKYISKTRRHSSSALTAHCGRSVCSQSRSIAAISSPHPIHKEEIQIPTNLSNLYVTKVM